MDVSELLSEPVASTSRGVFTLPYKPPIDLDEEEDSDLLRRRAMYETAWGACSERIQATVASLHDASLCEITQFVWSAHEAASSMLAVLSGRPPIRTGLIIGAGPGTSSLIFSALCRQLVAPAEGREACVVSRITSRECGNIKVAMRGIIAGFVGSAFEGEEDGEGDEDQMGPSGAKAAALLAPEDMRNLVKWYEWRRTRGGTPNPTLVVLLEDLEAMDGKVLAQIFDVLSRYIDVLPIVFLIGVATSANALHKVLPRRSTHLLDVAKFYVEPGIGTFNALIRGLFIDWDAPLALGPETFRYLLQTFEDMHQSIDAIISSLQNLYIHHFTTQPHALLTLAPPEDLEPNAELRETILKLPSVQHFLERNPTDETAIALQSDGDAFLDEVVACRDDRLLQRSDLQAAFELLLVMQEYWGKDRPVESMLAALVDGMLSKFGDEFAGLILQTDFEKLNGFLSSAVDRLAALHAPAESATLLSELTAARDKLEDLKTVPKAGGRINFVNINIRGWESSFAPKSLVDGDRSFSELVLAVKTLIQTGLRLAFQLTSKLLLNELWFANDPAPLKEFHPSILPSYLSTLKSADDKAKGETKALDVAVAYRLYRETGKAINLGDWWMTFDQTAIGEVVEEEVMGKGKGKAPANGNGNGKGKEKGKKRGRAETSEDEEEIDEEEEEEDAERRKHARFLRAVGDLAHTGFLQPTTRKAEHVLNSIPEGTKRLRPNHFAAFRVACCLFKRSPWIDPPQLPVEAGNFEWTRLGAETKGIHFNTRCW